MKQRICDVDGRVLSRKSARTFRVEVRAYDDGGSYELDDLDLCSEACLVTWAQTQLDLKNAGAAPVIGDV